MELTKKNIIIGLIIVWVLFIAISILSDHISLRREQKAQEINASIESQQALLLQSIVPDSTGVAQFSVKISPEAEALIQELNNQAASDNENAEQFFSPDMKYSVYISASLDPFVKKEIIQGRFIEDAPKFVNGIGIINRQTEQTSQLVTPNHNVIGDYITDIEWNFESDAIYFTSNSGTMGSYEVYRCDIPTGKITPFTSGLLCGLVLDAPHIGFIKIIKSCFIENKGGRHWYLAAISADGKTEIKLSEPSLDMPEIY